MLHPWARIIYQGSRIDPRACYSLGLGLLPLLVHVSLSALALKSIMICI